MAVEIRSKQRQHVQPNAEGQPAQKTERVERHEPEKTRVHQPEKTRVHEPDRVDVRGEDEGARFRRAGLQPDRSLKAPHVDEAAHARTAPEHDAQRFVDADREVFVKNRNETVAQLPGPVVAPLPAPAPRVPDAPLPVEPPVKPGMRPVELGEGPLPPGMRPPQIDEGPLPRGMRPPQIEEGPLPRGMRPPQIEEGPLPPGMRPPADPVQIGEAPLPRGVHAAQEPAPPEEGPLVIGGGNNRETHQPLRGDEIGLDKEWNARPDIQADGNRLPIRNDSMRGVVIQNLRPEDFAQKGMITESYRVLKPGSELTVMTGGRAGSEERAQTIQEIMREMEDAGFQDVRSEQEQSPNDNLLDFRWVLRGRKP